MSKTCVFANNENVLCEQNNLFVTHKIKCSMGGGWLVVERERQTNEENYAADRYFASRVFFRTFVRVSREIIQLLLISSGGICIDLHNYIITALCSASTCDSADM